MRLHRIQRRYASVNPTPHPKQARILRPWVLVSFILGGSVVLLASASSSPTPTTLNDRTFVPYTITERTELSPSSFVLTVLPQTPNPSPPYFLPGSNRWRHPIWSVEFKQPEVQIARHYTPLPPPPSSSSSDETSSSSAPTPPSEADGALRFYIRAVGDGEMSRYLSRLRVGQDVWIRGPHVGFDIVRRLGARKAIVFLAGGTGVVPGMQAARVALDAYDDARVGLLWAVRRRDEIQAPPAAPVGSRAWWDFMSARATTEPTEILPSIESPSPVARQLADMKAKYGERLQVQVVVDEEHSAFHQRHIEKTLTALSEDVSTHDGDDCLIHSQRMHRVKSEFEAESPSCTCAPADGTLPGKNLFIVSGPDGFVSHYAGPKVWQGGKHTQGPVGGVVGYIQEAQPQIAKDWLVLKL